MSAQGLPLQGVRVLDLTRARSGPTAVRQLADWGADVIMVESPVSGDELTGGRDSADFQNLHRNKRSILLDLKDSGHLQAFHDLVAGADVVVENFRPDVKHRLRIDYETLSAINPRIVYASISGFGEDGPNASRAGIDQILQGYSGLMSVTGIPGQGPVRAGVAVTDSVSGLYCAIAILTALFDRQASGKGRWVRTSLLESAIALLDFQAARWLVDREVPVQEGNHHPTGVPMGLFATADGHINFGAASDNTFARFARLAAREEWLQDERFTTAAARYRNRDLVREEIAGVIATRTSAEWIEDCNAAGLPCGPVLSIDAVFADPQVRHLGMAAPVELEGRGEVALVSQPITMTGVEFAIRSLAPAAGAHTREVLAEMGYDDARIEELLRNL
jgi:formyl-CoA transferase